MADPKPVMTLIALEALGCLAALGWLGMQSLGWRWTHMIAIAQGEQSQSLPPLTLLDQATWLLTHRLGLLQGYGGLIGIATVIGGCEGAYARRKDVLGGMRLRSWVCGVLGLALAPGLIAAWLLAPWPLPRGWMALGWILYSGSISWCLTAGRPHVA